MGKTKKESKEWGASVTHKNTRECAIGFDLTDFGTKNNFKELVEKFNLNYRRIDAGEDMGYYYTWSNPRVMIITNNNPITGKYSTGKRKDEKGYASYIGVEGECEAVYEVHDEIIERAEHIKDVNRFERAFI